MSERTGEDIIRERRESHKLTETFIKLKGQELYDTFDDNERTVVQFGMLPASKMLEGEAALLIELKEHGGELLDRSDVSRLFAVAIMDAANRGSKKMVV